MMSASWNGIAHLAILHNQPFLPFSSLTEEPSFGSSGSGSLAEATLNCDLATTNPATVEFGDFLLFFLFVGGDRLDFPLIVIIGIWTLMLPLLDVVMVAPCPC